MDAEDFKPSTIKWFLLSWEKLVSVSIKMVGGMAHYRSNPQSVCFQFLLSFPFIHYPVLLCLLIDKSIPVHCSFTSAFSSFSGKKNQSVKQWYLDHILYLTGCQILLKRERWYPRRIRPWVARWKMRSSTISFGKAVGCGTGHHPALLAGSFHIPSGYVHFASHKMIDQEDLYGQKSDLNTVDLEVHCLGADVLRYFCCFAVIATVDTVLIQNLQAEVQGALPPFLYMDESSPISSVPGVPSGNASKVILLGTSGVTRLPILLVNFLHGKLKQGSSSEVSTFNLYRKFAKVGYQSLVLRVILCFPFASGGDVGGHSSWNQFIAFDISSPLTLKEGATVSLHLNVGNLEKIVSVSNNAGSLCAIKMLWQEDPVTGPSIAEYSQVFGGSREQKKIHGERLWSLLVQLLSKI
ncbi:hypothetical protein NC653_012406 [Populus alba x Populus x berolinensis]|uniref:Uncharacterized protein n=1 Tax=Populus alba x Populus x berolinensis TaxID=444605 RepID=A0AAD6R519_9ROSI|nr:hypothetical protein NC653_012406 [Populus alba x Populus x berolinensis]